MKNEGIPVVKEGLPFIFVGALATIAFFVSSVWWLGVFFASATVFIICFFRNPERLSPVGSNLVCSPADGKVIYSGLATEREFQNVETKKVSIFMSIFDVHVNRVPIDGTVKDIRYHRGRFLAAFEDRASEENERNALLIETNKGNKLVLVQVAGLIARRIVCYPPIGSFVLKGQRMGLIRFGSRCDMYFPTSSEVLVKVGDAVVGGETILCKLSDA